MLSSHVLNELQVIPLLERELWSFQWKLRKSIGGEKRRELAEVEEVAEVEELHPQRFSSSPESATKKIEAQPVHSEKSTIVNQS